MHKSPRTSLFLAAFAFMLFLLNVPRTDAQCTFTNGTFEDGTLNGWTVYNRPTGSSTWFNWGSTLTPISSHSISAPPQGTRAAVTDQVQATTHAMYQDFTLPAGQSGTLSFYVAYNNTYTTFINLNTLDWVNNQQIRVDLMKPVPAANIETVAVSDVWLKLFQPKPGDPLFLNPTLLTFDVSGFAGLPARLRFAQGVGISYFPFQVDNICLSTTRGTITRPTATGSNVFADFGSVSLRFPTVATAGITSLTQLDPAVAQTGAPAGDTFIGPAYDLSTTATVTTPITVCMYIPSITDDTTFNHIRLLHKEAGIWIDLPSSRRNIVSREVCGDVLSLSPFTAAVNPLLPTAAPSAISGKVTAPDGTPLAGVTMKLGGGATRKTISDSNGNYQFEGVKTDNFYTLTPSRLNDNFTPSSRSFSLLGSVSDAVFTASPTGVSGNVIDSPDYFVRQHYLDFLGREPDESGFNFWSNQIIACDGDAACMERRTINVSAAYFLSIEFQSTGGLVDGMYRTSYNRRAQFAEFMPDTSLVAAGVVVGNAGWPERLAANKKAFADAWVARPAFRAAYDSLSNGAYVDALISNSGGFNGDRAALVNGLNSGTLTRAMALRQIAENDGFASAKRNEAFVMMEYFGYLRRDPDESGYQFWLNKLNQHNGNFEHAEMVKSFIVSGEYRDRFR
jgi:hypothetical protein